MGKLFYGGEHTMDFEETGMNSGVKSMTFRSAEGEVQGSAVLQAGGNFPGGAPYGEWFVQNHDDIRVPYYITSAATLLYAEAVGHGGYGGPTMVPTTFLELPRK